MTASEQIKVLCIRNSISVAELARRFRITPQNFNGKFPREILSIVDMERIAGATVTKLKRELVLKNGETV